VSLRMIGSLKPVFDRPELRLYVKHLGLVGVWKVHLLEYACDVTNKKNPGSLFKTFLHINGPNDTLIADLILRTLPNIEELSMGVVRQADNLIPVSKYSNLRVLDLGGRKVHHCETLLVFCGCRKCMLSRS
jgi:hypothetical protein